MDNNLLYLIVLFHTICGYKDKLKKKKIWTKKIQITNELVIILIGILLSL